MAGCSHNGYRVQDRECPAMVSSPRIVPHSVPNCPITQPDGVTLTARDGRYRCAHGEGGWWWLCFVVGFILVAMEGLPPHALVRTYFPNGLSWVNITGFNYRSIFLHISMAYVSSKRASRSCGCLLGHPFGALYDLSRLHIDV